MRKTIDELFKDYLIEAEFVRKAREETLRGYRQGYATFRTLMPNVTIENLDANTIVEFFKILQNRKRVLGNGKIKSGIMKSTARTYWSKLHNFFSWLELNNHIKENPFRKMRRPTVVYDDIKYLKRETIEKIFGILHNPKTINMLIYKRNLTIFYILLYCGLRREELLLLKLRDIDLERKVITIRAENSKIPRTRHIPLHSQVILCLHDYLKERKDYTNPFLFVGRSNDQPLSLHGLISIVQVLKKKAKVNFHLHQFRHTFAMNFLKTSNNIVKLKQLMGHSDIRMTLVYVRCLPTQEMRADIEAMSIDSLI